MNVLEKILKEIEERIKKLNEADNMCRVNAERNRNFESMKYFQSLMFATERAESIIGDIIRSHMDEAKDIYVPSNDGWIPVEERLPDGLNKELYDINLVTLEDGEVCIGVYRDDKKEWWTRKKEGETLYTTKHNVIAWQPLPEPYNCIFDDGGFDANIQEEQVCIDLCEAIGHCIDIESIFPKDEFKH